MTNLLKVLAEVKAHWGIILPVLLWLINDIANGLRNYPTAQTWFYWLSNALSVHHNADSAGTFKWPGQASNPPPNGVRQLPLPSVPPALLIIPLILSQACSFCLQQANKAKAECVAYNELVNCGPDTLVLIAWALPYLIVQDWTGLFAELEAKWPAEQAVAQCVMNQIEAKISAMYGPSSKQMVEWKTRRNAFEQSRHVKR